MVQSCSAGKSVFLAPPMAVSVPVWRYCTSAVFELRVIRQRSLPDRTARNRCTDVCVQRQPAKQAQSHLVKMRRRLAVVYRSTLSIDHLTGRAACGYAKLQRQDIRQKMTFDEAELDANSFP